MEHREYLINKRKELLSELNLLESAAIDMNDEVKVQYFKRAIHTLRSRLGDIKFRIGVYNIANNTKQQSALQKAYREKVKELIGTEEYYKFNMKVTEEIQKQYPAITKRELI